MKSLRQVWAAAQRNPIAKRSKKKQSGSEALPDVYLRAPGLFRAQRPQPIHMFIP